MYNCGEKYTGATRYVIELRNFSYLTYLLRLKRKRKVIIERERDDLLLFDLAILTRETREIHKSAIVVINSIIFPRRKQIRETRSFQPSSLPRK